MLAAPPATLRRWGLCFAAIVVLHGGAVWTAAHLHPAEQTAPPLPPAVMVILPPLHAPPPAPPRPQQRVALRPPPRPIAQPIVPRAPAAPHVAVPIPPMPQVKTPDRSVKADPLPVTQDLTLAPAATAAPQVDLPPAPVVAARAPGAIAPPSNALPNWQGLLLGRLEQFKRYPRAAQARRRQGVVYLRFSVDRRGKVVAAAIDQSSGVAALDEETLALIHRAEPLPPPPAGVPGDPIELVVPIQFFLKP